MGSNCSRGSLGPIHDQVVFLPLFVVGLLLNALAICMFVRQRSHWTDTHIYTMNLALADCALMLFLPFRIYDAFQRLEVSGLCTFLVSTHYVNMYASILTVTAISVHRYIAVKFPFHFRAWASKTVACVVCTLIWVIVVGISAAFHKNNLPENLHTCYERKDEEPLSIGFLLVLLIVGFLIPLFVITFCSTQTIFTLLRSKDEGSGVEKNKKMVGMITANLTVFIICYTPLHLAFLLKYLIQNDNIFSTDNRQCVSNFIIVSEWIATTNCCLDSIGYYFLLKRFYKDSNIHTHKVNYSVKCQCSSECTIRQSDRNHSQGTSVTCYGEEADVHI